MAEWRSFTFDRLMCIVYIEEVQIINSIVILLLMFIVRYLNVDFLKQSLTTISFCFSFVHLHMIFKILYRAEVLPIHAILWLILVIGGLC